MGRCVLQIMRGDFTLFKENLCFGELFLDTKTDKLYIGTKEKDQVYSVDLNKVSELPLKIGRVSMKNYRTSGSAATLYKDWEEFLEWRKNRDSNS